MKKYQVTLYYHTHCTIEVEAEDKDAAIQKAYQTDDGGQLLANLQEDSSPDVEEI